jgi:hypothetical protein
MTRRWWATVRHRAYLKSLTPERRSPPSVTHADCQRHARRNRIKGLVRFCSIFAKWVRETGGCGRYFLQRVGST